MTSPSEKQIRAPGIAVRATGGVSCPSEEGLRCSEMLELTRARCLPRGVLAASRRTLAFEDTIADWSGNVVVVVDDGVGALERAERQPGIRCRLRMAVVGGAVAQ